MGNTALNSLCYVRVLQLSMEKVQAIAEQVEIKAKVVQTEVKAVALRYRKALEERECELLWKVSGHVELAPRGHSSRLFLCVTPTTLTS